jgi:hypothetical protein
MTDMTADGVPRLQTERNDWDEAKCEKFPASVLWLVEDGNRVVGGKK